MDKDLHDAESESTKFKPVGRLDMSHGFLRHIRRNQIARDDYDREVKQAKEKQRQRPTTIPRHPKRPDKQVYHLRHQNGSESCVHVGTEDWNESSSGTDQENTGTELFWLDYQADSGQITSFIVYKEDKPETIVERVSQMNILDSAMRAALLARVGKEMDKRCDKY
ncbi:UPF0561 protein C2orf68 -like protein [Triplophysa tibetana]|uniref:UPF0561 protein C2orf68-like protein n=1 Tax=Triplophysa tibetana TaxID=1572043 RepID=A0A5A9P468_9TELE|nr:UPF0561 protein C2orf68 -like protein [Triplophysa tibetana]